MGNLINLPNIKPESIANEGNSANTNNKADNGFSIKNYLNVRLEKGQTSKNITIRLLPMDLETGNPFVKVHTHNVKVPTTVSESGYKSYLCLTKNKDIDHGKYGTKCPFCEMNKSAYEESLTSTDPVEQQALRKISLQNLSRESIIVRCIERGKEDEGVKFWKFNTRIDQTDPYNQILKLYKMRKEEGDRDGIETNILDIYNGVDLTITITDGNAAPTIVDGRNPKPLSKDEEQMKKWIYDEKKWQDVFTAKPYEYLSLVSQMKTPWYDKESGMWVDKEEYDKIHNDGEVYAESTIEEAEAAVLEQVSTTTKKSKGDDIVSQLTVKEDEETLPF